MEKRRSPLFVGKRRAPIFIGKRRMHLIVGRGLDRAPKFVGKRRQPLFVGRRSYGRNNRDPVFSYVVMRRSVSSSDDVMPFSHSNAAQSSLLAAYDDIYTADKRASGRYIHPTLQAHTTLPQIFPNQHKRFTSPYFIGKRTANTHAQDYFSSESQDNSGINLVQPHVSSKRFEVPMFVGKRDSIPLQASDFWILGSDASHLVQR